MYAKFDSLVREAEAQEQLEEEANRLERKAKSASKEDSFDEVARQRFLASLPAHMRDDPHILRSIESSDSFKAFSKEMLGMTGKMGSSHPASSNVNKDIRTTREDVERWARGEDEAYADLIPRPPQSSYQNGGLEPPGDASAVNSLISKASKLKAKGNRLFKSCNLAKAVVEYSTGIELLSSTPSEKVLSSVETSEVWAKLVSNRAACYLRLGQYEECIKDCSLILDISSPRHLKALWRRSQARLALGDSSGARQDLVTLLDVEPDNAKASQALRSLDEGNGATIAAKEKKTKKQTLVSNNLPFGKCSTSVLSDNSVRSQKEFENQVTALKSLIASAEREEELHRAVDVLANNILKLCHEPNWQTVLAPLYLNSLDDDLLGLCDHNTKDDVVAANDENERSEKALVFGASVSRIFNGIFARLLASIDEPAADDPASPKEYHFFGSAMLSTRSSLRALLRTSMSGNKIQLEKMQVHLQKMVRNGILGDLAWVWALNADRELCSRIRSNDLNGALFHAFEGEVIRHVVQGPEMTAKFFKRAELKGGIQATLGGPVQARIQRFSIVLLGQEHLNRTRKVEH